MLLPPFELHRPETLPDALVLAGRLEGDFDYVAGGTDLLQNYKNRIRPRGHLISLNKIKDLTQITVSRIGALSTLTEVEFSPEIRQRLPGLVQAISKVATPLVRNTATLGGNLLVETRCFFLNQSRFWRLSKGSCMKAEGNACLVVPQKEVCYATFSSDVAPLLMTLDASVHLVGPDGERDVPLREFYIGDGMKRFQKVPAEIIAWIDIPDSATRLTSGYKKLRIRDSFDYPDLGVAASLKIEAGRLERLSLVLTAIESIPLDLATVAEGVVGQPWSPDLVERIAREAEERARPVKNVSMSPSYRKRMVLVYVRRLLTDLGEQASVTV